MGFIYFQISYVFRGKCTHAAFTLAFTLLSPFFSFKGKMFTTLMTVEKEEIFQGICLCFSNIVRYFQLS